MKPEILTICALGPYQKKVCLDFSILSEQPFFLIHGATGAGKTSLVNLIPRFYDATQGRVLVDGQDVRMLTQRSLREQGIEYSLKPERLAYYSYYMFFFWLAWLVRCSDAKEIESFLAEYGEKRIEYADDLWKKKLGWARGCLKERRRGLQPSVKNIRSRLFVFYCSVNFALPGGL